MDQAFCPNSPDPFSLAEGGVWARDYSRFDIHAFLCERACVAGVRPAPFLSCDLICRMPAAADVTDLVMRCKSFLRSKYRVFHVACSFGAPSAIASRESIRPMKSRISNALACAYLKYAISGLVQNLDSGLWTLDSGLWTLDWTHGLDCGLIFGLDFGLTRRWVTTISNH